LNGFDGVPVIGERSHSDKLMKIRSALLMAMFAAATAFAADVDVSKLPPAAKKEGLTFDKDIRPLFEKSCFKCHGPEKKKGDLRVDSLEATLKGGENGPNVIKGDGAKSSLVHSIARLSEDEAMPPEGKGDPLTKEQVGLVRAWIDQGAK
jgi:mono/diheme cytochrome c family protein